MSVSSFIFKILFLGDSLTAGYLLNAESAYPALIEKQLKTEGYQVQIVNGGVSGDTTSGGLRRLEWMLKSQPDFVVVALGSNDMLRGLPLKDTRENLRKILKRLDEDGIDSALMGVKAAPNLGRDFERNFNTLYTQLGTEFKIPVLEEMIASVRGKRIYNLYDGIHPNIEGHALLAKDILEFLRPSLKNAGLKK